MNANVRSLLLALPLVFLPAGCGGHAEHDEHHGHAHGDAATEPAGLVCPPCGMDMPADFELVEVGGMRFAFCNEACRETVAKDPAKYAKFAAP